MAYIGKEPNQKAVRNRFYYTATGGETSLSSTQITNFAFEDGAYVDVSLNGIALVAGTDYNTTTANTIGGLEALAASDVVEILVYEPFSVFSGNVNGNFTVNGDLSVDTDTLHVDSANNRVGIGTTSPSKKLHVKQGGSSVLALESTTSTSGLFFVNSGGSSEIYGQSGNLRFDTNSTERMRIDSNGNVGVGTTSPASSGGQCVDASGPLLFRGYINHHQTSAGVLQYGNDITYLRAYGSTAGSGEIAFYTGGGGGSADSQAMRIDSSGNLLVGGIATDHQNGSSQAQFSYMNGSYLAVSRPGTVVYFNRQSSDGQIMQFRKDGSSVGGVGSNGGSNIYITSGSRGLRLNNGDIAPITSSNVYSDNTMDLGRSNARFDDVYATNGTIQTSDENEKQQIASLTSAEITAAKAISKLFKTFKWNDSVTANGDNARTHTGVIAQQVETAMTDAGLDAGDYAFFISADWYVDANGEEVASDAVGAIAKNRKGIRYPELLAFVGAATEQRLADIETRLTALENV